MALGPEDVWTLVLSFTLLLCCTLLFKKNARKSQRLPPGPAMWPIVGNMFQVTTLLSECFTDLSKKYGPLVFVKLGSMNVLVASSAEMAKAIMHTHDNDFCSRPQNSTPLRIIMSNFNGFIFAEYGDRWRQLKKILVTELFTQKRLATFQPKRTEQQVYMLRSIRKESEEGKVIQLREKFYQCFCNVVTTMLANKSYFGPDSSAQERREFLGTLDFVVIQFGLFNPGDYFPILKSFDILGVERRTRIAGKVLHNFLQNIIDEHRQKCSDERGESYVEDFVDTLLACPGFDGEKSLPDATIRAILLDLLFAGIDTSSNTIEWALAELLRNPHVMRKAQAELDSVVGRDRLVTEGDIPNLTYINAILRENFRYHPAVATGVPRVSPKGGFELAGYYIPEDTTILVNNWAIGRDPASWERPDEFYPERFLGNNPRDVRGKDFELIPFGAGRRMCIGLNLGLILTHLTLANFIHCFDWRLPEGQTPESLCMKQTGGLTAGMKDRLQPIATPRLPAAVFASSA